MKLLSFVHSVRHGATLCGFFLVPWQTIWIIRKPIVNGFAWEAGTVGIYLSEILIMVSMLCAFLECTVSSREYLKRNLYMSVSMLGIICTMIFFSNDRVLAFQGMVWLCCACWIAHLVVNSPKHKTYITTLLYSVMLSAMLGIIQFSVQEVPASEYLGISAHNPMTLGAPIVASHGIRLLRAFGSMPHPNIFGGLMVCGLVISLLQFQKKLLSMYLLWFVLCVLYIGLLISFSRSAWLMASIACISMWFTSSISYYLKHRIMVIVFVLSMIFLMFYWPFILNRAMIQGIHEERSLIERRTQLYDAFLLFRHSPFFGIGMHQYTVHLKAMYPNAGGYQLQNVHVTPLIMVIEWGIIGLIVIVFLARHYFSSARQMRTLMLIVCILSPALLFDHYLWSTYSGMMIVATMSGVLWSHYNVEHKM